MSRTSNVVVAFGPSSNVIATSSPADGPLTIAEPNQDSFELFAPVQATISAAAHRATTGTIQPARRTRRGRRSTLAATSVEAAATPIAAAATVSAAALDVVARTTTTEAVPAAAPPALHARGCHGRGATSPTAAPASNARIRVASPGGVTAYSTAVAAPISGPAMTQPRPRRAAVASATAAATSVARPAMVNCQTDGAGPSAPTAITMPAAP